MMMDAELALSAIMVALFVLLVVFRLVYTMSRRRRIRRERGLDRPEPEITLFGDGDSSDDD